MLLHDFIRLCLYEHAFSGRLSGRDFGQYDGRPLLIGIQRGRPWALSKRWIPMCLEKFHRDGARSWKVIKVNTIPRRMTDLIIIFTVLPNNNGVVKSVGFHIPNFVARDEFSHTWCSRISDVVYAICSRIKDWDLRLQRQIEDYTVAALVTQIRMSVTKEISKCILRIVRLLTFQSPLRDYETDRANE